MKNIILVLACLQDNTVNNKITGRKKSNKTTTMKNESRPTLNKKEVQKMLFHNSPVSLNVI